MVVKYIRFTHLFSLTNKIYIILEIIFFLNNWLFIFNIFLILDVSRNQKLKASKYFDFYKF